MNHPQRFNVFAENEFMPTRSFLENLEMTDFSMGYLISGTIDGKNWGSLRGMARTNMFSLIYFHQIKQHGLYYKFHSTSRFCSE